MRYLPDHLKGEYSRLLCECGEIDGISHPLINVSDVLRAYFILVNYFTDESSGDQVEHMLVGLRSADLLASALTRQAVSFGGKAKYSDALDICASLFFGLVKNHAFADGNKRVSLLILLYQLDLYKYLPNVPVKDFEKLVLAVAANELSIKYPKAWRKFKKDREVLTISYRLRRMVRRKDNTYHVAPTMKEFSAALEMAGVSSWLENGKLHFSITKESKWPFKAKKYSHSMVFGGWSRVVGPSAARDAMEALGIYSEYPSYQEFLDGKEPMYQLVEQFEVPLRRLKDE